MFKHYFEQIHNVAVWPIVSLTIFFIFFICLLLYTYQVDNSFIQRMKNLPFNDEQDTNHSSTKPLKK